MTAFHQDSRLTCVKVVGLFNRFTYQICIERAKQNRAAVTVITAPNGYGKSSVLRLISAFFRGDFDLLSQSSFRALHLVFDDDTEVVVERNTDDDTEVGAPQPVVFKLLDRNGDSIGASYRHATNDHLRSVGNSSATSTGLDRKLEEHGWYFVKRVGESDVYRDYRDGSMLSESDLTTILRYEEPQAERAASTVVPPPWLHEYCNIEVVKLVGTGREVFTIDGHRAKTSYASCVETRLAALKQRLHSIKSEQEKTFRDRLASRIKTPLRTLSGAEAAHIVNSLNDELTDISHRLMRYSVEPISWPPTFDPLRQSEGTVALLLTIVDDINAQAKAAEEFLDSLDLFLNECNSLLTYKSAEFTGSGTLQIVSDRGRRLNSANLSTGENQLLSLIAEITCATPRGSMFLLDEPELSIHPAWQEQLMSIITNFSSTNAVTFVVATHSPSIASSFWDSTVELTDQVVV